MTRTLYLLRHGQTLFNTRKIVQGWCDSPLTELGRAQACQARDWFRREDISFDHVYSSSSERALDTANIVAPDMPCTLTKGLKEFSYGSIEGCSYKLIPSGAYQPYGNDLVAFGGNSEEEVAHRMYTTLSEIMERPGHERVLAVSHGACSRAFIAACDATSHLHVPNRVAPNCCIQVLHYRDGVFDLIERHEPVEETRETAGEQRSSTEPSPWPGMST